MACSALLIRFRENLDELVGVADDEGEAGDGLKFDFDVVAAQGVFVELERALDDHVHIEGFFLGRGGARKFQKILDDAGGAAGLAMGHFQLAARVFVNALAIAEEFAGAENGGEGIVEFVGDAGEHLAHGGELFGLNELAFEALDLSDVAAGNDRAFDNALCVEERAEIAFEAAPFALLVADANFDGAKFQFAGDKIVEKRDHGRAIVGVRAFAEGETDDLGGFVAEDVFEAGADEGVAPLGIDDEDKVGEAVHQTASEFLLLVELLFHGAAFGEIHERALIADDAAGGVANGGSGVEAIDGLAVFAAERDFAAVGAGFAIDLAGERVALHVVDKNFRDFFGEQLFLGAIAEHIDERGIHFEDFVFRSDDVNAFLEIFEELGEAGFAALHGGDIAGEHGDAVDFLPADHRVGDAIEEVDHVALLEADLHDAGPDAALDEAGLQSFEDFERMAVGILKKISETPANNFLEGLADEIGEAAVDGADFAVEAHGEKDVVEGVDQVTKALLRLGNHGEKMVQLLIAGERGVFLIEAADQAFQFCNFVGLFPDVDAEERDQNDEADGQRFEMKIGGAEPVPGHPRENGADEKEDEKGEAPEFVLALLKMLDAFGQGRARVSRGELGGNVRIRLGLHGSSPPGDVTNGRVRRFFIIRRMREEQQVGWGGRVPAPYLYERAERENVGGRRREAVSRWRGRGVV